MLVDWFTVVAQVINFLILVALLKYFLYGRIIQAMERRENGIAAQFADAEAQKHEAEREAASLREKNEALAQQRETLLAQSQADAEQRHSELLQAARTEVSKMEEQWRRAVEHERNAFLEDLRRRAATQTCAISRRALAELANADLEQTITEVFVERIKALDQEKREFLADSVRQAGDQILVRSAFRIPEAKQQEITRLLQEALSPKAGVRFESNRDLICGIELRAHGHKIGWSIDSYLESLEESIGEVLRRKVEEAVA